MYIMLTDVAINSIITVTGVLLAATISPLILMFSDKKKNDRIETKEKKKIAQNLMENLTKVFLQVQRELDNAIFDFKSINPPTENSCQKFVTSINELIDMIKLLRRETFHQTIYRIPRNIYTELDLVIFAWRELIVSMDYSNLNNFLGAEFEMKHDKFESQVSDFIDQCRDYLDH